MKRCPRCLNKVYVTKDGAYNHETNMAGWYTLEPRWVGPCDYFHRRFNQGYTKWKDKTKFVWNTNDF